MSNPITHRHSFIHITDEPMTVAHMIRVLETMPIKEAIVHLAELGKPSVPIRNVECIFESDRPIDVEGFR